MKSNKFWSIVLMLVLVFSTAITVSSCSKDDDDATAIVDGIDTSLIPGCYEFNGNIAPSFKLFKDGTCTIHNNGLSGSTTNDKWEYQKSTHVLLVGTHVYTIKMLTKESLVAEWSSVKYGVSTSSWKRTELTNK